MRAIDFLPVVAIVGTLVSFESEAAIPGTATAASVYEVTITQVDLCTSAACTTTFLLGAGSKAFDIAAATSGADVGGYIDDLNIPLFQIFTHVRATISTTISLGGTWTDGDGDACGTSNETQASNHNAVYAASAGGTATAEDFVIPDVGFQGTVNQADYDGFNLSKSASAATATITFPLTSSYVNKGVSPRIEIQFNTSSAFGFVDGTAAGAGTACQAFPRPPEVTITITDP